MINDCCCREVCSCTAACGCCEGTEPLTPLPTANRPGLSALSYRVGTHAAFLETMKARLSSENYLKLAELTTREGDDAAIALLDAWATVADVLTFYQERIANEGYLRTATERRSVLELGRLVGYQPRPGVASIVYLAYTIDENFKEETTIAAGSRAQSVPGPGELPQSFETSENLQARANWNKLRPRMTRPQNIKLDQALTQETLYLDGIATILKPNDRMLLVFGAEKLQQVMRRVEEVSPQPEAQRTRVLLQPVPSLVAGLMPLAFELNEELISTFEQLITSASVSGATSRGREGGTDVEVAQLARVLHRIVELTIENLQLGNYPPLTPDYFTRRKLYLLLGQDPEAMDELTAFLPRYAVNERLRRNGLLKKLLQMLEEAFVVKLTDLLAKDQAFRSALLGLVTHIAEELKPTSVQDRIELGDTLWRLDQLLHDVKSLDESLEGICNAIESWFEERGKRYRNKLETQVISLLRDRRLHYGLVALLGKHGLQSLLHRSERSYLGLTKIAQVASKLLGRLNELKPEGDTPVTVTEFDEALIGSLNIPPRPQYANSLRLPRDIRLAFQREQDAILQLLVNFAPALTHTLYPALAKAEVKTEQPDLQALYVLRLTVPLFGNNAPRTPIFDKESGKVKDMEEWDPAPDEGADVLFLDYEYGGLLPESYVVIQNPEGQRAVRRVISAASINRSQYNLTGKSTFLRLSDPWRLQRSKTLGIAKGAGTNSFASIRETIVYAQSERLNLAEQPITVAIGGVQSIEPIELDGLVDGLPSGRWLIVSGERTDVQGTSGVKASELVMLAGVKQSLDEQILGDKTHTFLTLAKPLAYAYRRDSVTIYGNVVKAAHGETRKEVLGSGDGAKALPSFVLKQPPLTYVSASNPSGVDSTLKVFVNDVQWRETDALAGLAATDRNFITKTDEEAATTVVFGNGREGARLPTGIENIKSEYRSGIGKMGNVGAGQISLLITRPLGVKDVTNPLPASGGADKEGRDRARLNAPLAVKALDRLVSVRDYEDFARIYAGIGKAHAVELSNGGSQLVYITVAGASDIPIDKDSDLYRNLLLALLHFGNPYRAIQLEVRELLLIVVSARIRILPEYQWEPVVTQVRNALLDAFSFERRELGQDVLLSEVMCVIQGVRGVAYLDVEIFGGLPERKVRNGRRELLTREEIEKAVKEMGQVQGTKPKLIPDSRVEVNVPEPGALLPAQLAFLTPEVPETLILNQIT